ncbi:MAG: PadR family transcriptional regulator, partial [Dorea sp.]|nr:PadR family transcriptional regulator [Dorea sp.]
MDQHIKKVYVPMTETAFFILLCLRKPNHGYGVVQMVEKMTDGAIRLTPGTMYGSLSKMEKDNIIRFIREEDKRRSSKERLPPAATAVTSMSFCSLTISNVWEPME